MGQPRMDNSETLETFGKQDTGQRQTKRKNTIQKTNKMSNIDPTKPGGEPKCSHRDVGGMIKPDGEPKCSCRDVEGMIKPGGEPKCS